MDNLKISEEEIKAIKNREAVKKCMSKKDRLNVILPAGTIKRINDLGYAGNSFARELILSELEKIERMKK